MIFQLSIHVSIKIYKSKCKKIQIQIQMFNILSGATASTRGASGHSAFSSAKMAKRALAQVIGKYRNKKTIKEMLSSPKMVKRVNFVFSSITKTQKSIIQGVFFI